MSIYEFLGGLVISLGLFVVAIILGVGLNGCVTSPSNASAESGVRIILVDEKDVHAVNYARPIVIKNQHNNNFDIE